MTNSKLDPKESLADQEKQENIMIQQENNKAWEEAHKLRASLTDSDFYIF